MQVQIRHRISTSLKPPISQVFLGANLEMDFFGPEASLSPQIEKKISTLIQSFDHRQLHFESYEAFGRKVFEDTLKIWTELASLELHPQEGIGYKYSAE